MPAGGGPTRRACVRAGLVLPLAGLAGVAGTGRAQASYPARPLQLVVAFAPGGAGDILARLVARKLSEGLGQPVVVENRPVPVAAVASVLAAKADGHTLLMAGSGTALTSALYGKLSYDLMRDFIHVSTLSSFDLALVAAGDSALATVADVLAYAKRYPGQLNIGTVRVGSTQNLAAEMFKARTGVDAVIVPFKATGDIVSALRAQNIHVAVEMVPALLGALGARTVKALAVAARQRNPSLPSVPTLDEAGLDGFEASSWNGIAVAAGTPPAVVERLSREIRRAVASPEVQRQYRTLGYTGGGSTPEEMGARMRQDIAKWSAVIEQAGIRRQ